MSRSERPPPDFSATRDLVGRWIREGVLPAAAVLVARRGERLFEHAAGCARREPWTAITPDAIWAVASVSKPVAAAAVMQLVDAGRIGLDQPVVEILPDFAPHREHIRVRHLLNHTSGMCDESPTKEAVSALGLTTALARVSLLFEAGTACAYSTNAYTLLGPLVERVTGLSFDAYTRNRVFAPLGMHDSSFHPPDAWSARIPAVYGAVELVEPWWSFSHRREPGSPGAGLFASLRDLAAFGQAFADGGRGLLSPESHRAMTTWQTAGLCTAEGSPQSWGLGWYLYRDERRFNGFDGVLSRGAYGHGGATGAWLCVDPEQGLVLVLLANRMGLDLGTSSAMQEQFARTVVEAVARAPAPAAG